MDARPAESGTPSQDPSTGVPPSPVPPVPSGAPPSWRRTAARGRTARVALVAIVVAIVALVAGLWAAGVGPFARPPGAGAQETFREAAAVGLGAADEESGGPWTAVAGEGLQLTIAASSNVSEAARAFALPGCNASTLLDAATTLRLPASTTLSTSGEAASWLITYLGNGGLLVVAVLSGSASALVKLAGPGCALLQAGLSVSLPPDYLDSPAAVRDALADGGATFAAEHSAIDLSYLLTPEISASIGGTGFSQGASWEVEITNCDLSGTLGATLDGEPPALFQVAINATSGVGTTPTSGATSCPAGPPA